MKEVHLTPPNINLGCLSPTSPSQVNQKQLNLNGILNQVQDTLLPIKDSGESIVVEFEFFRCRNRNGKKNYLININRKLPAIEL